MSIENVDGSIWEEEQRVIFTFWSLVNWGHLSAVNSKIDQNFCKNLACRFWVLTPKTKLC